MGELELGRRGGEEGEEGIRAAEEWVSGAVVGGERVVGEGGMNGGGVELMSLKRYWGAGE